MRVRRMRRPAYNHRDAFTSLPASERVEGARRTPSAGTRVTDPTADPPTDPLTDPENASTAGPTPGADEPRPQPSPPAARGGYLTEILVVTTGLALAIAVATWLTSKEQIAQLQHDVAALQDAHERLAMEVTQGRIGAAVSPTEVIDVADAPARGPKDARVTLIEFSDYECPFCIRHFQQTMPLIDKNYVQSGKIRYVFRDMPVDANHPQAIKAHEAARCALEQNKFWDIHARLFSAPGTHTPLALEDRAREVGLDLTAFRACIQSGRTTAAIRATSKVADNYGATGTPWFFIGLRDLETDEVHVLKPLSGAQPYIQFAAALDDAIKQADAR
jgi:protein-disulfide isomerase